MSSYQKFFKERHKTATKKKVEVPKQKSSSKSLLAIPFICILFAGAAGVVWFGDDVMLEKIKGVRVQLIGSAGAEAEKDSHEKPKAPETKTETKGEKGADEAHQKAPEQKSWSEEDISLFKKLEEKKIQLDHREAELAKLEEELQKQKEVLERKIASLETVRTQIAEKLEGKVAVDKEKVDNLVKVYTNMKPSQAAKIMESMNEDLAVEIMGKMKNKSTAAILNLMEAEKVKKLTERFAGYSGPAADLR